MSGIYDEIRIAIHMVWRRRWLALAVMWAICLIGWLAIALIPNSYESGARIFVSMQSILPEKIGISQGERQQDIERVRQTLTSADNLEKVVRGSDLIKQAGNDRDVGDMVARLQRNITVKSPQDNMFEISAKTSGGGLSDGENARLAMNVVQRLIDIFVAENLAGDRDETSQTIKFLDGELARREQARCSRPRRSAPSSSRNMPACCPASDRSRSGWMRRDPSFRASNRAWSRRRARSRR